MPWHFAYKFRRKNFQPAAHLHPGVQLFHLHQEGIRRFCLHSAAGNTLLRWLLTTDGGHWLSESFEIKWWDKMEKEK
jgi:hypothetical protein